MRRIEYAGSVHDEREIEAVVSVLRGGPTALRIGKNVRSVELLGLEPGDEVVTSAVTFSTDVAPLVRAGLVPVFVDVEADVSDRGLRRPRATGAPARRRTSWAGVTTAGVWSAEMTSYLEFSYLELLKQTDGGWATR